jgi:hypothetical protein
LFFVCLLIRAPLSRLELPLPFGKKITLDRVGLISVPIVCIGVSAIADPIYHKLFPPPPKKLAVLLLPRGTDLPLDLKKESFARIRSALLDAINSNLELDVLPIDEVVQNFPAFDNKFSYGPAFKELVADAQQYMAGHELRFLAISFFVQQTYKDQHSPIGIRAGLYESNPDDKNDFHLVVNSRSDTQVQGFAEHHDLLSLLVGYRLMRDLLTESNKPVSPDAEAKLSAAFSDGFHVAWQNLILRPRMQDQVSKVLDGTVPCRTFQCLDLLDQGLSNALATATKTIDNSVAQSTQRAVMQADGAVQ